MQDHLSHALQAGRGDFKTVILSLLGQPIEQFMADMFLYIYSCFRLYTPIIEQKVEHEPLRKHFDTLFPRLLIIRIPKDKQNLHSRHDNVLNIQIRMTKQIDVIQFEYNLMWDTFLIIIHGYFLYYGDI